MLKTTIVEFSPTKFVACVHEFKFDMIRQESYWVTRRAKTFTTRALAEAFIARFDGPNTLKKVR